MTLERDGEREPQAASDELSLRAEAWVAGDPDPATRAELEELLEANDLVELAARFGEMAFGTAGMRAPLGAGPARMNRAVVIRAAFGLMNHLRAHVSDAARRGVVVGFDARRMSRTFAEDVAGVLAAGGFGVLAFREPVPTPLVSFAVSRLGAAAGVMITASHNPAEYNGFKIYGPTGAQVVSPDDTDIAAQMARAPEARAIAHDASRAADVPRGTEEAYLDGIRDLLRAPTTRPPLRIVYTPLHGVGFALARRAFAAAGFDDLVAVREQVDPDPCFPTAPFPNPEEPGTLDLARALARETRADLVIAHDPDADRLAVMVPAGDGDFAQLTGNQVGVLLGHYLLAESADRGSAAVIASIVSSPMLGAVAERLGAHYEETLTGFKWIMHRALELERKGLRFLFGYEEALGYAIGIGVRDKDGISAGVVFAELAAVCRARAISVLGYLEELYRQLGLYVSAQRTIALSPGESASAIMDGLRRSPPTRIAERAVLGGRDYARGEGGLPPSDVLAYELEGGTRVIVRPSGTEPKVKCYLDHRQALEAGEPLAAAQASAARGMDGVGDALVELVRRPRERRTP